MADVENFPVATVGKGRGSEIRVALAIVHGANCVDLRTFAAFDGSEEPRATKRGVCVSVARLPELRKALEAAEREAHAKGWLQPEGGAE